MLASTLSGPYHLSFDDINAVIRRKSAGAFALGYVDQKGDFRIRYIGRSDDDVRQQLCNMIGSDQYFKYSYYVTAAGAFYKECELFHDFRPQANHLHPERPKGTSLDCPRCRLSAVRLAD
jgi:hypothetical protein